MLHETTEKHFQYRNVGLMKSIVNSRLKAVIFIKYILQMSLNEMHIEIRIFCFCKVFSREESATARVFLFLFMFPFWSQIFFVYLLFVHFTFACFLSPTEQTLMCCSDVILIIDLIQLLQELHRP